jgi:activator of HSP90 ATPase
VPGNKIVQKWRFTSWPEEHFSTVEMVLSEKKGKTILTLTQKGVPVDDCGRTEDGWRRNLWGRGKMMFGFGPVQLY